MLSVVIEHLYEKCLNKPLNVTYYRQHTYTHTYTSKGGPWELTVSYHFYYTVLRVSDAQWHFTHTHSHSLLLVLFFTVKGHLYKCPGTTQKITIITNTTAECFSKDSRRLHKATPFDFRWINKKVTEHNSNQMITFSYFNLIIIKMIVWRVVKMLE